MIFVVILLFAFRGKLPTIVKSKKGCDLGIARNVAKASRDPAGPVGIGRSNLAATGQAPYFQALAVGISMLRPVSVGRAFNEVCDYTEMKVRTLLRRRTWRRKTSVGWRRRNNVYLYEMLRLYWDWKVHPLASAERFA